MIAFKNKKNSTDKKVDLEATKSSILRYAVRICNTDTKNKIPFFNNYKWRNYRKNRASCHQAYSK